MNEQMRKDFESWASDNLYSIAYTPNAECGCEGGPVYADSRTHAAWWAYRHGLQKAEEYAAKRYADGVNAAVAEMLPELERVSTELAAPAAPQAEQQAVRPFLVRDAAELVGSDVPTFCRAMEQAGLPRGSTNSAIDPEDALRVARALAAQQAERERAHGIGKEGA